MTLPMNDDGQTASDNAIVERIVTAVMEHKFPPGAKLAENALCEVFNASRTQIRRILVVLGERDVVKLHPNRGAFVWSPSAEEAREVFAARRAIERAVIEKAPAVIGEKALRVLRDIVAAGAAANARDARPGDFDLQENRQPEFMHQAVDNRVA